MRLVAHGHPLFLSGRGAFLAGTCVGVLLSSGSSLPAFSSGYSMICRRLPPGGVPLAAIASEIQVAILCPTVQACSVHRSFVNLKTLPASPLAPPCQPSGALAPSPAPARFLPLTLYRRRFASAGRFAARLLAGSTGLRCCIAGASLHFLTPAPFWPCADQRPRTCLRLPTLRFLRRWSRYLLW